MTTPEEVLRFWLDEVGPQGWYAVSDELDGTVRDRFQETWEMDWATSRCTAAAF